MKAADVMTRHVITVMPDASILQAARLMLQHRISGLPVVDKQGRLIGIVTEGDFLRRAEIATERHRPSWLSVLAGSGRLAVDYVRTHGRKVEEVMSRDPHTVSEDTSLEDIVRTMEGERIKRVPVLCEGKLVGIITRANLLHALASVARTIPQVAKDDVAIRDRILSELGKQPWHAVGVDVVVQDGDVDLSGTILDERLREALKVLIENVPGVKEIHDHIVWVEPYSGMAFASPEDEEAKGRPAGTAISGALPL
jgi:CBS domain-containing protein